MGSGGGDDPTVLGLVEQFLDNDVSGFYDINNELDAGMSNDDGVALMRERHGDQWADMMRYYLDNFVDSLTGVVPGARVLINDLEQLAEGPVPGGARPLRHSVQS